MTQMEAIPGLSTREVFFKLVFGQSSNGYVCLAFLSAKNRKDFREQFFKFPEELPQMLDAIDAGSAGYNVYFCPQVFGERRRKKEAVIQTPNAWADLDLCGPENLLLEPTAVVESSPGKYQAFWSLDAGIDPHDAQDISRRIAYKHAAQGADRSGWDLTQLLRVPDTYNYKYIGMGTDGVPKVELIGITRGLYRLEDFEEYPELADYMYVDIPMPDAEALEGLDADRLLQSRRTMINPAVWGLYTQEPGEDWSRALWNLQMLLAETGYTREEAFVISREAKCNKYARDGKAPEMLWNEVCRAFAKNDANLDLIQHTKAEGLPQLLSEEERRIVADAPDTFVERYIDWAKSLGDAARQYHQAGAFVALSAMLAGPVRLPTSFGTVLPNLWFMILADTTLTRKSTAMDICMEMVQEVDPDIVLATDGSIEGLMTALSTRPGRPSVFWRDEFSGLLEMITKKDYYAGMPEVFTKLYDGKMQKRILRKEIIEVNAPVLITFAGGIKSKITQILTHEQVSSGFMPRFIFITAESDPTKMKPLGPPTRQLLGNREAIKNELQDMFDHYHQTILVQMELPGAGIRDVPQARQWEAELTDDAWIRYNELEYVMVQAGLNSERPDIMTPTYDRLSKSILKAAVLLAAARQRGERIVVEEIDILRAIGYGEQWRNYASEVMANIGMGAVERQMMNIMRFVMRMPGCARSRVMQQYHLNARTASEIFDTLEQRGWITRRRTGRTETLFPNIKELPGA